MIKELESVIKMARMLSRNPRSSRLLALGALGASAAAVRLPCPVLRPGGTLNFVVRRGVCMSAGDWKPPPGFIEWTDDDLPNYDEPLGSAGKAPRPEPERQAPSPVRIDAELDAAAGHCMGCGARFQSMDAVAPGYVPVDVLDSKLAVASESAALHHRKAPVCQRCHGLRYQNRLPADELRVGTELAHATLQPDYFLSILKELSRRRCLVVVVVDLFDFHGSLIPQLGQVRHARTRAADRGCGGEP